MKIKLKFTNGKSIEEVVHKSSVTIGRSQKCDVIVADESLSRTHCLIDYESENFFITDLGSANGIFIDGKKISPHNKVQFSTFQDILIGQLELAVSYEEEAHPFTPSTPKPKLTPEASQSNELPTKPARVINRNALSKPFSEETPKKKVTKTSRSPLYVVAFLLIAGAVYYQFQMKAEDATTAVSEDLNIPAGTNTPDEFLSTNDYSFLEQHRSCSGEAEPTCQELALRTEEGEGFTKEGQQAFLFIRPSVHMEDPKFKSIKELADKDSLIGIYLALRSPLFESFRNKTILQLHVVIRDENFRPYKVFRFHTKYFSTNGPEKARLLTELVSAFTAQSSINFWKEAAPIIKEKSLLSY